MNKLLIIVDPQYDFIEGSLAVKGAKEAMDNLAKYIEEHKYDFNAKVITLDWHPTNHISFKMYPPHCIQYSIGSTIHKPIMDAIEKTSGRNYILLKGQEEKIEEYSIFQNYLGKRGMHRALTSIRYDEIEVCGICGDICVLETLKDLVGWYPELKEKIVVNTDFCPSIDGGEKLNQWLKDNEIKMK